VQKAKVEAATRTVFEEMVRLGDLSHKSYDSVHRPYTRKKVHPKKRRQSRKAAKLARRHNRSRGE